ncbi:formyl transferase [Obelidium mucronatum]|nr:formyl transferase [Obelidium mucronatum]
MLKRPPSALFFGSDEFSVICCNRLLKATRDGILSRLEIVTPPDNPRTKVPEVPLKAFARKYDIPLHIAPPKSLVGWTPPSQFDLGVVVSFGYFLPASLIRSFPLAALNVHPSLLPRYRGAAPIQHTILNGDTETGVSIMELHEEKFDAGRIYHQSKMSIGRLPFYKDLHDQLATQGAEDLVTTISNFDEYKIKAWAQDLTQVSHARKISKTMAAVNFQTMDQQSLFTLHRAIGYKIPLYCQFREKRVQLHDLCIPTTDLVQFLPQSDPGTIVYNKNVDIDTIFVMCADTWIGVKTVKVQGKREQNGAGFNNGYQLGSTDRFDTGE